MSAACRDFITVCSVSCNLQFSCLLCVLYYGCSRLRWLQTAWNYYHNPNLQCLNSFCKNSARIVSTSIRHTKRGWLILCQNPMYVIFDTEDTGFHLRLIPCSCRCRAGQSEALCLCACLSVMSMTHFILLTCRCNVSLVTMLRLTLNHEIAVLRLIHWFIM